MRINQLCGCGQPIVRRFGLAAVVFTTGCLAWLAAGTLPASGASVPPVVPPPEPPTVETLATSREQALPPLAGSDKTYLEFLRRVEATTSPVVETKTPATLVEGPGPSPQATTLPAWLIGPTTGSVMGRPLPLSLKDCVDLALQYNFGLQQSERDLLITRSSYRQERYEFVPFVDLISGYTYADSKTGLREGSGLERTKTHSFEMGVRARQNLPTGGDISVSNMFERSRTWSRTRIETVDPLTGRVTDISRYHDVAYDSANTLDFLARQPLLRGGGFKVGLANLRLARLANIQSELRDQIRRRDLVLSVIRSYFLILQRQLDAEVSVESLYEREDFHERTRELARLGEIAPSETSRTQILLLDEEVNLRQREQNYFDSIDRMLILMGLALDTPMRLRKITARVTSLEELGLADPATCVREALANRPEFIQADIDIRQAKIGLEVAKNGTLPFLDIEARYFDAERGRHLRQVNSLDDSRSWSFGALFDLPFPNMAQREALKRAKIRLEQSEIARQSLERDIIEEVRGLVRSLNINGGRIVILEKRVDIAERNLLAQRLLLEEGESSFLDVRQTLDEFSEARRAYNNAVLFYQSDLAGLHSAIGWPLF